ncbi:thiamine-monophosphate kinase [Corynebacterium felinum]|uniref:Thiamine-monophosphate kinase n=2 Tax=Corynebacterium felinum TaxID=131318 RepID=A0ABU2BAS3_9CORY|nr:thiamine-monophosphate kinase [Corynebacterium felinum]
MRKEIMARRNKVKNPTLAEVGEHAVIDTIMRHAPSTRNGDDAAVLDHGAPNSRTVITTDMLVEGRHFNLDWSNPAEIGRKAITQNFADVEAMGARPVAALLALSAPNYTRLQFVADLARGIGERVLDYGAELVGGDITDGENIVISVTAVGQLGGSLPALRLENARPGQILVASGGIGDSAAGYALISRFGREGVPEKFAPLIRAHCSTEMPPGRGFVARAAGVTAMTDNSDGLIADLGTLARRSGVSVNVLSETIAPSPLVREAAELVGEDPWKFVLSGGEDHTLVGTTFGPPPTGFRQIGTVVRHNSMGEVTVDSAHPHYREGWTSF